MLCGQSGLLFSKKLSYRQRCFRKADKVVCLILALAVELSGPLAGRARSQEEHPPAQAIEVQIDPLPSVLTAMNIPARAALCGLNSWLASIVMVFSAGMRYADAAKMIEDGCSGPWIITREMLEESRKKEKEETSSSPRPSETPSAPEGGSPPATLP
ncbi:MAG: hypothetical protein AABZ71_03915 [Candidatus Binatota bacterium]